MCICDFQENGVTEGTKLRTTNDSNKISENFFKAMKEFIENKEKTIKADKSNCYVLMKVKKENSMTSF